MPLLLKIILLSSIVVLPITATITKAQQLFADLSSHTIYINSQFRGNDLTLFGYVDEKLQLENNDNLIIIVKGPKADIEVVKKQQHYGLWIGGEACTFANKPTFYSLYSHFPIDQTVPDYLAKNHNIGYHNLFSHQDACISTSTNTDESQGFINHLYNDGLSKGLVTYSDDDINFITSSFFRLQVRFSEAVKTGHYLVKIFLIKDSKITSAQTIPLHIIKSGLTSQINNFATKQATWYALLALLLATSFGYLVARKK
jgi:uncharacterized protein (TIGR02186 family)